MGVQVDRVVLTPVVQRLLGTEGAVVLDWQQQPVRFDASSPVTGGLHRFHGTAQVGVAVHNWSLLLKIVQPPPPGSEWDDSDPSHWSYSPREPVAYTSGLLATMPPGLTAAACYGVEQRPEGVWLWLEEVRDAIGPVWPLARFGLVARHLGRWAGAPEGLRPVPDLPWLCRGALAEWVEHMRGWLSPRLAAAWQDPGVGAVVANRDRQRLDRLLVAGPSLAAHLEGLPQTLVHWDLHQGNLFARHNPAGQEETVVIDWAFLGPGALGEDVGGLIGGNLFYGRVKAAQASELDRAAFAGYVAGLQEMGWQGDIAAVRLAATAHAALRWGLVAAEHLVCAADGDRQPELIRTYAASLTYLLDLAEEAAALAGIRLSG